MMILVNKLVLVVTHVLIFLCYFVATICLAILTGIGYLLTWLYKKAGWPNGLHAINCWAFVIAKWLEEGPRKVYLVTRLSAHGPIPHVMFARSIEALQVMELIPIKPKKGLASILDAIRFKGRVREGKGEEKKAKKGKE